MGRNPPLAPLFSFGELGAGSSAAYAISSISFGVEGLKFCARSQSIGTTLSTSPVSSELSYKQEIMGMKPVMLNGDLSKI